MDLYVATPARIVVLGAGPIGIETALYARYLGYDVTLIEQRAIAATVLGQGHLVMHSPFGQNRSTLGLAALCAQDSKYQPPADNAILTCSEWAESYLLPLAQTDLVVDHLLLPGRVVRVGLVEVPGGADASSESASRFRVFVQSDSGRESILPADVVIDTTGVSRSNGAGPGGLPASGEPELAARITYGRPDVLDTLRSHYAGRRILIVGSELTAASTVCNLASLAAADPNTRVFWASQSILPQHVEEATRRRIALVFPQWEKMIQQAVGCAHDPDQSRLQQADWLIRSVHYDEPSATFQILFDDDQTAHQFDRIIVDAGQFADASFLGELCVTYDPVFGGLATLAEPLTCGELLSDRDASEWRNWLPMTEPHFYVLGAKTFGGIPGFSVAIGLAQIRALFQIIGGRESLDLYATA